MKRPTASPGFSLLEVMVSVSLFSIVAAGLAAMTVGTTRSNNTSKNVVAASALVHDKIEQLRSLDPDANPADFTAGTHNDPANPITATGTAGGWFTRSWVVTRDTPATGLSTVVVTVSWSSHTTRSISGVTYVCTSSICS
jgi:prepilin-type N-terminal cleavage/methylation domain-containing protein